MTENERLTVNDANSPTLPETFLQALAPDSSFAKLLNAMDESMQHKFMAWVDRHRIGPQLHATLADLNVPAPIAQHLHDAARKALPTNLAQKGAAADVRRQLAEINIESLPFKGPDLAEFLFGGASYRECYDSDLFVRPKNVRRARERLLRMGYVAEGPKAPLDLLLNYRHELGFEHPLSHCRIELHWRVVPSFLPCELTVDKLFDEADKDAFAPGTSHLPTELAFLLLVIHGNRHEWSHLCWLLDLIILLKEHDMDVQRLHALATTFKLTRMLHTALALLSEILGASVFASSTKWSTAIVDGWLRITPPKPFTYAFVTDNLDTLGQRITCWRRLIFQPTVADFNMLPLPRPLRWINAVARPFRLMKRSRERE